jgi:hypothetical protein
VSVLAVHLSSVLGAAKIIDLKNVFQNVKALNTGRQFSMFFILVDVVEYSGIDVAGLVPLLLLEFLFLIRGGESCVLGKRGGRVVIDQLSDEGFFENAVDPNTFTDRSVWEREDPLAVLDIVQEFSDVVNAILVDLLAMLCANPIFKEACAGNTLLGINVLPVAINVAVVELARILVSVVKVHLTLALHKPVAKVALVDSCVVD